MPEPTPTSPDERPDRRALLQAYQDLVRSEKEKQGRPVPVERPVGTRLQVLVPLLLLLGGLTATLVLRPAWFFIPAPVESAPLRDARLRVLMYLQIDRIEQFRSSQGRLPSSLSEAGADTAGLRYTPSSSSYSVTGSAGGASITYDSRIPPRQFLGGAYRLIQRRRGPR